jgi:predicted dehydrogenase
VSAIRLGIIGTGIIVRDTHVPILRKLRRRFRVVAVADVARAKAERVAAMLPGRIAVFADHRRLLDMPDVDAVLIAVPPFLAAGVVIDSLRADKHVLAEKPMANTVAEARKVIGVWRGTDRKYMVAEQFYFIRPLERIRQMARSGDWPFGRPRMVELHQFWKMCPHTITKYYHSKWRHDRRLTYGYLLEGGCHTANPLREAFGMPRRVQSRLLSVDRALGANDTLIANFEFPGRIACHLVMAYAFRTRARPMMEVFAKDGTITFDGSDTLRFIAEDGTEWEEDLHDERDCYHREWLHFHDVVAKGRKLLLTPQQTRDDLVFCQRLIDAAI